ncbi:MAG: helix-turn-helix transcriptional regulator [Lachnospiraceae bacterium]|nr:helix-turn-helix transcriptional regulator [Lachnospiraceae bacterium]
MGIRNAGTIIKEARLRAGLTQEQMSFGICSLVSLCNIENGKLGVSSSTFQALMKRAGEPSAAYPLFKNRKDFDAYMLLKNVRLYTEKSCLSLAYNDLFQLKLRNFGDNLLYYQEALFFYARIKYLTYHADYSSLLKILNKAINLTHPDFDFDNFEGDFLSSVECEILFLIAHIYINTGKHEEARRICDGIGKTLDNSLTDDNYTAYIRMLLHSAYAKLYFSLKDYETALGEIYAAKNIAEHYYIETNRVEIILLKLICEYCVDSTSISSDLLYMMSLASYLECGYVPKLKEILRELKVPEGYYDVEDPKQYDIPDINLDVDIDTMSDGALNYDDSDALTIGSLIGMLRQEQRLPMNVLCDGLCSLSKLSKIENNNQAPGLYLTEALLNRLGYSERNFVFYGNVAESEYWRQKNFLISKDRQGDLSSKETTDAIEAGLSSEEPALRQLCLALLNNSNYTYFEREKYLLDAIKISIPDYSIENLVGKRLSWIEITILNGMCSNLIHAKKFEEADKINSILCTYAKNSFVTPSFKSITLFLSLRLHFKYLYNLENFTAIVEELDNINDEFILKSAGSAADFLFYASQAYGELHQNDKMIKAARVAAGYFLSVGLTRRKNYLLSEIKRQFDTHV